MDMSVGCSCSEDAFITKFSRFGNFNNYYKFNPAENRIRLLPDYAKHINIIDEQLICLDVGCNVGELTQALHKHMTSRIASKCKILAIDFDETLIKQALETNNDYITFICADVLSDHFEKVCQEYLTSHNRKQFDIIYCFSMTMWIHINYGDESLKQFLIKLSEKTNMLVMEPQPWKCYTRAVRKVKRSNSEPFTEFSKLQIRNNVEDFIDSFLEHKLNFVKILESAPTTWGRQIRFYKKKNSLDS